MADWVVVSSVASAAGTLALAGTTYFSIRSANRAARVAELSLLAALRPLLVSSSPEDATHTSPSWTMSASTLQARAPGLSSSTAAYTSSSPCATSGPGSACYIPPGKIGFWQVAFRDADDRREDILAAIESGRFTIDLLYGDYEGGQRVITRFGVVRDGDRWNLLTARHWQLDRPEIARPRGSFVEGRYEAGS